jgi:hypothetical protein
VRVTQDVGDLIARRVFAIACRHPDGNDADWVAAVSIHKLLLARDPIEKRRLPSQPTISRFKHTAASRMLAMSEALADTVIARHRRRRPVARLITMDLDVTADPTHGAQQLTTVTQGVLLTTTGASRSNESPINIDDCKRT